jgi:RecB family exonuclease
MPYTILDWFSESHPNYPINPATALKVDKYKAKASSEATEKQDPDRWLDLAKNFLESTKARANDKLTKAWVAAEEDAKEELATE